MSDVDFDLTRNVKISAPYDDSVVATVKLESVPVWFDLGWQKVADEDYGLYANLQAAAKETSPSYDATVPVVKKPVTPSAVVNPPTPSQP